MRTIHYLSTLLLFAAFLASCSNEDAPDPNNGNGQTPIAFYQPGVMTKGKPYVADNLNGKAFKLHGYEVTTPLKKLKEDPIEVTPTGGAITTDYTWPANPDHSVRFFAHYPLIPNGGAFSFDDEGQLKIASFDLGTTWTDTKQEDILYASIQQKYDAGDGAENKIPLNFQHALARVTVQFTLAGDEPFESVYVKEIKLQNVYNGGAFTVINATDGEDESTKSKQTGEWTNPTTGNISSGTLELGSETTDLTHARDMKETTSGSWLNPLSANAGDGTGNESASTAESFFVIPMGATDFTTSIKPKLVLTVMHGDYAIENGTEIDLSDKTPSDQGVAGWIAGHHYNYRFRINVKTNKIEFASVTVQEWVSHDIEVNPTP